MMTTAFLVVTPIVVLFSFWVGMLKHQIGVLQQQRIEGLAAGERRQHTASAPAAGTAHTGLRPAPAGGQRQKNGVLSWTINVD